jgi:hypothetical protein
VTLANAWCTCHGPMSCVPTPDGVCVDGTWPGPTSVMGAASAGPSHDQYSPAQRTGPLSGRSTVDDRWHGANEPYPTAVLNLPVAAKRAGSPDATTPTPAWAVTGRAPSPAAWIDGATPSCASCATTTWR